MGAALSRKEETIENFTKAVRANSIKLLKAIRTTNVEDIKSLLTEFKRLERKIYRRLRRNKNIDSKEKRHLNKLLAELQAIYHKDKHELKKGHFEKLKILAGEEEVISEEIIKDIQKASKSGMLTPDTLKSLHQNFKQVFELLEPADIIAVSYAGPDNKFGQAAQIFETATGENISHVGIIDVRRSIFGARKLYVIEAAEIVQATPISTFIFKGKGRVAIYRYKNKLTRQQQKIIIKKARSWTKEWHHFWRKEVNYDYALAPGDMELYCSELVDEAYKAAGIQLTNKYMSVDKFHKTVAELIAKGTYKLFGVELKSSEEAIDKVVGPKGFYSKLDINKVDKFRESIIPPSTITKNSNTVKVFDNLT
jgi:hypothetical protein